MNKFTLSTDSTADLEYEFATQNGIALAPLTFTVERQGRMEERKDAFRTAEEYTAFYRELREGAVARTSMLNYGDHLLHFTRLAEEGAEDVLHFTISSGLSPTREVAAKAAAEVKKKFPKFTVYVVDPLTATVGQGALVRIALRLRNEGKTVQEAYDVVMGLRQHIEHLIVPKDLLYLHRGGRVSAAQAVVGSVLGVRPIITFTEEGTLAPLTKLKGEKRIFSYIEGKLDRFPPDPAFRIVEVVHTDAPEAAETLRALAVRKCGFEPHVSVMGPVIGTHIGPGAFAFGYISKATRHEFNVR